MPRLRTVAVVAAATALLTGPATASSALTTTAATHQPATAHLTAASTTPRYKLSAHDEGNKRVRTRWNPCQTITYKVNPNGYSSTADRKRALATTQKAFQRLHDATGITFAYRGTTKLAHDRDHDRNFDTQGADILIVFARPLPTDELARHAGYAETDGIAWTTGTGKNRVWHYAYNRAAVFMNTLNREYNAPDNGPGPTFLNAMTHEVGHAMGLGHVKDPKQIMGPYPKRWGAGYGSGDKEGLAKLGRKAGCINILAKQPDYR